MRADERQIDACAIRILDLAEKGLYSYNTDVALTNKQKNLKRDVKKLLTEWFSQGSKKSSMKLILDALINVNSPTLLRQENELLKKKLEVFENREGDFKASAQSIYKDELREELRAEMDQDREAALESSRRVNRKLMYHMSKLEDAADKSVSEQAYEQLRELNVSLHDQCSQLREKTNLSKKAIEIEKILKLEKSSSEDNINEIVYD